MVKTQEMINQLPLGASLLSCKTLGTSLRTLQQLLNRESSILISIDKILSQFNIFNIARLV
jgi:hypothetical protein